MATSSGAETEVPSGETEIPTPPSEDGACWCCCQANGDEAPPAAATDGLEGVEKLPPPPRGLETGIPSAAADSAAAMAASVGVCGCCKSRSEEEPGRRVAGEGLAILLVSGPVPPCRGRRDWRCCCCDNAAAAVAAAAAEAAEAEEGLSAAAAEVAAAAPLRGEAEGVASPCPSPPPPPLALLSPLPTREEDLWWWREPPPPLETCSWSKEPLWMLLLPWWWWRLLLRW